MWFVIITLLTVIAIGIIFHFKGSSDKRPTIWYDEDDYRRVTDSD